jgi:hypothetical protein
MQSLNHLHCKNTPFHIANVHSRVPSLFVFDFRAARLQSNRETMHHKAHQHGLMQIATTANITHPGAQQRPSVFFCSSQSMHTLQARIIGKQDIIRPQLHLLCPAIQYMHVHTPCPHTRQACHCNNGHTIRSSFSIELPTTTNTLCSHAMYTWLQAQLQKHGKITTKRWAFTVWV